MTAPFIFFGVGSPVGDDQIGWWIVESLRSKLAVDCELRIARTPSDILEPLSDRVCLMVCDACQSESPVDTLHRIDWPSDKLQELRWSGTHDLKLYGALQLAKKLDWLPARVIVWGVEIEPSTLSEPASNLLNHSLLPMVLSIADQIIAELNECAWRAEKR